MCKTYHWTCHACGRSQSRGQRCSARAAASSSSNSSSNSSSSSSRNDTNCPTDSRTHGPPPQAEHSGIRCAFCHTPSSFATNISQPKTETQTVNPASLASKTKWEARQPMMPPSSWNPISSPPGLGVQHQAAPIGRQSPSSGAAARNYIAVSTMPPNAAMQHHHRYPSHPGHAQANFPYQRLGGTPASVSLPPFSQPHDHARFTSSSSSRVPIDPQILPSRSHHQHPPARSYPHGAASAPPSMPPTSTSAPAQHHSSAPQAHPLQPQSPPGPTSSSTPSPGASGEAGLAARPDLRSPADMLASMAATRTALFVQAEAQRAAAVERGQSKDEGVAFGNHELQAAWYNLWEGCGVPHATVSAAAGAAAAAARKQDNEMGKEDDKDAETCGKQESSPRVRR